MRNSIWPLIAVMLTIVAVVCIGCDSKPAQQPVPKSKPAPPAVSIPQQPAPQAVKPATPKESPKESKETKVAQQGDEPVNLLQDNIVFVLDGSGSMAKPPKWGEDAKITQEKAAVRKFFEKVPPDRAIGLFAFDNRGAKQRLPIGLNNREAFLREVDAMDANDGTPLGPAILAGTKMLTEQRKKQLGYGTYTLVVVTDGEADDMSQMADACKAATNEKITILSVGFYLQAQHSLRKFSLEYRDAKSPEQLEQALTQLVLEASEDAQDQ